MSIWEAILKALGQLSPGHEFGLLRKGFRIDAGDGSLDEAGLTEMVCHLTGKLVSDGCVSRRMRELSEPVYWKRFGVAFEYEVVRRGWYRVTRLEPFVPTSIEFATDTDLKTYTAQPEVLTFRPVEGQGGELRLF